MVTFFRKAQLNAKASTDRDNTDLWPQTPTRQAARQDNLAYEGMLSPEDEMPYVMVRPKVNRKSNGKRLPRMRGNWD